MGRFEFLNEAFVFGLVEFEVGGVESSFFGAGLFLGDQVVEVGQLGGFVPCDEVGFDDAGSHQVDAGQQNAETYSSGLTRGGDSLANSFHCVAA